MNQLEQTIRAMCDGMALEQIDEGRWYLPEDRAICSVYPDGICLHYTPGDICSNDDVTVMIKDTYNQVVIAVDIKLRRYHKPMPLRIETTWKLRALRDTILAWIADERRYSCSWMNPSPTTVLVVRSECKENGQLTLV